MHRSPLPWLPRLIAPCVVAMTLTALLWGTHASAAGDPAIVGYPGSMASTGDSITRAFETCPQAFTDCPANSWSTGTNAAINTQYLRILAANPAINGHNNNDAQSGATMAALNGQVATAVSQHVDYVTILMGANDVCTSSPATMTSVATFASEFQTAMNTLSTGLPDARIFVASIPDIYNLWSILSTNSNAVNTWNLFQICQSMLKNPTSMAQADVDRRALVQQRNVDLNTQLTTICAQYVHCHSDGGAAFNLAFTPADVSTVDYFHPSIDGQTLAASASWPATFDFTDATPPVSSDTTAVAPGGIAVTITATDDVGVSGIEYQIDNGSYTRYTAPVVVPQASTIMWRAVDVNGNSEATHAFTPPKAVGGIAQAPPIAGLPPRGNGAPLSLAQWFFAGGALVALAALAVGGWLRRRRDAR